MRGLKRILPMGRRWREGDDKKALNGAFLWETRNKKTPVRVFNNWLRGPDLNRRPSGYEPDELPGCSTPRLTRGKFYSLWVKNANTAGIWCTETGRKICRHYSDPRHILSTFIANHVNEYPVHFHLLNTFAFSCSPLSALFYKKHTKLFLSPIKDD